MDKHERPIDDPSVGRLADLLDLPPPAALGLRSMLWELSLDVLKSPDLTAVPASQWALIYSLPKDAVPDLIDAFVEAGMLTRRGDRLLLTAWEHANANECHAAFRRWLRSKPGTLSRLAAELFKDKSPSE